MLKPLLAAALAALLATSALAHDGPHVTAAYARASAKSGAVFLTIENHGGEADRLIAVATDAAARAELHTHSEDANGVMQMIRVEEGFEVPAHGSRTLDRGGDHIMLLGLTRPLAQGDTVTLTLTFSRGEVVTLDVPVDNDRKPGTAQVTDHSAHPAPSN